MPHPTETPLLLIVEDDVIFRELIRSAVAEIGVRSLLADSVAEGMEILEKHQVDAILSDIDLRDSSGLELLYLLRKAKSTIPLFYLTGNADATHAREALRLGAVDFLAKPIRKLELLTTVSRILKLGAIQKANEADQLLNARKKVPIPTRRSI